MSPDDLARPLYGATFDAAVRRFFRKYATFSGRASRSEYWWVVLFEALLGLVVYLIFLAGAIPATEWVSAHLPPMTTTDGLVAIAGLLNAPTAWLMVVAFVLSAVTGLVLLLPTLALTWRRLHDANLSGALWFLSFIPGIGGTIVFVLTLLPSDPQGRRFDEPRLMLPGSFGMAVSGAGMPGGWA
jgi:uncharacterized membrane protein YhaH (DUF805 family)